MKAYLAFEGMARFWTEDYWPPTNGKKDDEEMKDNLMGHLTNYSLNKTSSKYKLKENFMTSDDGSKRLLSHMFNTLKKSKGVDIDDLKNDLKDMATKIVFALQPFLINSFHVDMGTGSEINQNCFHVFGIDILLDEKHKPWLLEINCFPSFSIFQDITESDPADGFEHKIRKVSEFDKYLKSLIIKEAIEIVKDKEIPLGSVFEQIYPPQEFLHEYKDLNIFNDARAIFELLAGFKKPDYLTISQFQRLSHFPGMTTETLTGHTYPLIFKQFARKANKTLMTTESFNVALEYIGRLLYPNCSTRLEVFSKVIKQVLDCNST